MADDNTQPEASQPTESEVQGQELTFTVKLSDKKIPMTITDNQSVSDLKEKLSTPEHANIPANGQRLIYSGRVLKDEDKLFKYQVKDGNTMHLIKSAPKPSSSDPSTGSASSSNIPPGAGNVPSNIATGPGTDPLAGLTGARYAGFAQMPGANTFGPDGGVSFYLEFYMRETSTPTGTI